MSVHAKRDLYVKVTSKENQARGWTLSEYRGGPGTADFNTKWFDGGDNVTAEIEADGYEFRLKPDKPSVFRISIKPVVDDPGNMCLYGGIGDPDPEDFASFFGVNGNQCS